MDECVVGAANGQTRKAGHHLCARTRRDVRNLQTFLGAGRLVARSGSHLDPN